MKNQQKQNILQIIQYYIIDFFYTTFDNKKSIRILQFLLLNLSFMCLEMFYGYLSNSLGLYSEAFHLLCDTSFLLIGLLAKYISNKQVNGIIIENIAGLANALFLVNVSINLLLESIERIMNYKVGMIKNEYNKELVVITSIGLFINITGLYFFHENEDQNGLKDQNLYGIFLHVLADTLGSAGVLVSCVLINLYNLEIADPISAFFRSIMIFVSVLPLLCSSLKNLCQIKTKKT